MDSHGEQLGWLVVGLPAAAKGRVERQQGKKEGEREEGKRKGRRRGMGVGRLAIGGRQPQ